MDSTRPAQETSDRKMDEIVTASTSETVTAHEIRNTNAKQDLKKYIGYLKHNKKNPQAAQNVLDDFRETRKELASFMQEKILKRSWDSPAQFQACFFIDTWLDDVIP